MVGIQDGLIVHRRVNRRHRTRLDTNNPVQYEKHGAERVGRAGCSGDNPVLCSEHRLIQAPHNRVINIGLRRLGEKDPSSPSLQVLLGCSAIRESTCALQYQINPFFGPRERCNIALLKKAQTMLVDPKSVVIQFDLARESPVGRVIASQMGDGLGVSDLVYGNQRHVAGHRLFRPRPEDGTANTAKAVYR